MSLYLGTVKASCSKCTSKWTADRRPGLQASSNRIIMEGGNCLPTASLDTSEVRFGPHICTGPQRERQRERERESLCVGTGGAAGVRVVVGVRGLVVQWAAE